MTCSNSWGVSLATMSLRGRAWKAGRSPGGLNASWRQRHRPGGDRVAAGGFEGGSWAPEGRERAGRSTTVRSSQPSRGAPCDRRSAAVAAAVRRGVLRVDGHNGHRAVGCYEQAESRKDEKLFHGCPLSVRRQPCHGLAASHVTESTGCVSFRLRGAGIPRSGGAGLDLSKGDLRAAPWFRTPRMPSKVADPRPNRPPFRAARVPAVPRWSLARPPRHWRNETAVGASTS